MTKPVTSVAAMMLVDDGKLSLDDPVTKFIPSIHPITILSTLPSAGIGALLILIAFHFDLSVIALIGIILLIGIVKKNAIMYLDRFRVSSLRLGRVDHPNVLPAE